MLMKKFGITAMPLALAFVLLAVCSISCDSCSKNTDKPVVNPMPSDSIDDIAKISEKIRKNPRQHALFFQRSALYFEQGNVNEAANDIEIALKLDSLNPVYLLTAGDYFLMLGKSEKSKEYLDKCIARYPQNTDARFKRAQLFFYVKQYDDALAEIAFIEQAAKQSDKTYYLKAMVYKENNMFQATTEALRKTIEYNQNHTEAYNMLAMMYCDRGDPLAVEYFNTATRLFPENLLILLNAGLCYEKFGFYEKTREVYEKALRVDSSDYQANYNMGYYLLVYEDDFEKARLLFANAIEIRPKSPEAYYNRGLAFENMGKFAEAKADYYKALELVPNFEFAVDGLNRIDRITKQ